MQNISPVAVQVLLVVLEVVGLVGVWLLRIGERSPWGPPLRRVVMFCMVLLGIVVTVSLTMHPQAGLVPGAVLAVMAVTAVVDFGGAASR